MLSEKHKICALLAGAVAAAGCLSGCASSLERSAVNERSGRFVGNQGSSCELVFAAPYVNRQLAGVDPRAMEEYSRNDANLNIQTDGPLLASGQWPVAERASLDYPRWVWIPNQPNQLLYFQTPTDARTGGYSGRASGGGTATWNGWR